VQRLMRSRVSAGRATFICLPAWRGPAASGSACGSPARGEGH
jgi:hypothetical protein